MSKKDKGHEEIIATDEVGIDPAGTPEAAETPDGPALQADMPAPPTGEDAASADGASAAGSTGDSEPASDNGTGTDAQHGDPRADMVVNDDGLNFIEFGGRRWKLAYEIPATLDAQWQAYIYENDDIWCGQGATKEIAYHNLNDFVVTAYNPISAPQPALSAVNELPELLSTDFPPAPLDTSLYLRTYQLTALGDVNQLLLDLNEHQFNCLFGFYRDNPAAPVDAGVIHLKRKTGVDLVADGGPFLNVVLAGTRVTIIGALAIDDAQKAAAAKVNVPQDRMPMSGGLRTEIDPMPYSGGGFSGQ